MTKISLTGGIASRSIATSCHSGHFRSGMQNRYFTYFVRRYYSKHYLKPRSKSIDSINNTACRWSRWQRCCFSRIIRFVMARRFFVVLICCHAYQATVNGVRKGNNGIELNIRKPNLLRLRIQHVCFFVLLTAWNSFVYYLFS